MRDAIRLGYSKLSGIETNIFVDSIGIMDDNRLKEAKSKINIIVKEK